MSSDKVFWPPAIVMPVTPAKPIAPVGGRSVSHTRGDAKDFQAHLDEAKGLKLSQHARERLSGRQIPLTTETWGRVLSAVDKVAQKGGRDSLVLVGDLALVVNVPNRTVITAVDGSNMKERVFTNIDSAVIA